MAKGFLGTSTAGFDKPFCFMDRTKMLGSFLQESQGKGPFFFYLTLGVVLRRSLGQGTKGRVCTQHPRSQGAHWDAPLLPGYAAEP